MKFDHFIFDLNGTLANTKRAFVKTRYRFIENLVRLTGVPIETLLEECRHRLEGNSLNPDIAPGLPSIMAWISDQELKSDLATRSAALADAIKCFRRNVIECYRLPQDTERTLKGLQSRGVTLSIWSGSRAPYVVDMLKLFGLDGIVAYAFCPAQLPGVCTSLDELVLTGTKLVKFDADAAKPSSILLSRITQEANILSSKTVLVGNSLRGDGQSTIGTGVCFVLFSGRELDTIEAARYTALKGASLPGPFDKAARLSPQELVRPIAKITSLHQLLEDLV